MADDVVEHPRWTIDPRVRDALVLESARDALAAQDPSLALQLAEELLDESPDDVEGLLVVAEAGARCGHAAVAQLACAQAAQRGADPGVIEAEVWIALGRADEALRTLDRLNGAGREDARCLAARSRALDLAGDRPGSDRAWSDAARREPGRYPPLLHLRDEEWESSLLQALSGLEPRARTLTRQVDIRFADLPDVDELASIPAPYPALPPTLDGLLRPGFPPILSLFRRNLLRGAATPADVVERVRAAIEVELDHLPDAPGARGA